MSVELPETAALRAAFDASFAAPVAPRTTGGVPLLGLRLGDDLVAMRLDHLGGLHPAGRLFRVPGGPRGWLGLAGLRGRLVAVYDMAALLGRPADASPPGWLVVCRAEPTVAFAFAHLDGLLMAEPGAIVPAPLAEAAAPERVRLGAESRAVLHPPALLELVERVALPPAVEETP